MRKLRIQASITVPQGWGVASALQNLGVVTEESIAQDCMGVLKYTYGTTSVERLADSPVLAGEYMKQYYAITPDAKHLLALAPDRPGYSEPSDELLSRLRKLVQQTELVFGPRHYEIFWMLVGLSLDKMSYSGREHHDSFDVTLPLGGLDTTDRAAMDKYGPVLSHEFIHSWCGKFRRPAGHVPHDFSTPLDGRLLWVYEGLTQYYGNVLAVRSGLMSREGFFVDLAEEMAWLEGQAGRRWRSVEDTGTGCSLPTRGVEGWSNWLRGGDYYQEGMLVWLDVDTLIQLGTAGSRSLDDFARSFFGQNGPRVLPYSLEDIVAALQRVMPYDWEAFFQKKVVDITPDVNGDGIIRAGYRFGYTSRPGSTQNTGKGDVGAIWNSIGVKVNDDGLVIDVRYGGPADDAKLAPNQTLLKVGGAEFSVKALKDEISKDRKSPIKLTAKQEDEIWEVDIPYDGALRYPRIMRRGHNWLKADFISAILDEVKVA